MEETDFAELKRYVRFDAKDEACLRAFHRDAATHFDRVVEQFYARVQEHQGARRVFAGGVQTASHEAALRGWLDSLLQGPWDDAYYDRRMLIGKAHVIIELPQRYVFAAMAVIRETLVAVVARERHEPEREAVLRAVHKLLDLELAIILESYREAYVGHLQHEEEHARDDLQQRLASSEARCQEIVEKAEALITTLDGDGHVLSFNHKCEELTGISRNEAHGASWLDLFVPTSDHAFVTEQQQRARSGESASSYEGWLPHSESRDSRVRWHFTTLPDGGAPALCAIGIDVSHEHELGVRTRRAERMAALGTMAQGLAHEFRNPLNSALLQLTMAERRLQRGESDGQGATAAVSAAMAEIERLGALVQDFLQFAQPQVLAFERIDLTHAIEAGVARLAAKARGRGVELRVLPGEPVFADADSEKIGRLLENLARNAIEAVHDGGHVELGAIARGPYAELSVWDDGPGLAPDAPVFAPFFTTKESGTGLGLAIVHRIAMDHGGQVSVHSVPGSTRFTVSLPRAQPA